MKNLLFGLLAVGIAFSLSAFKNIKKNPPAGTLLVQTSLGQWEIRTDEPAATQCKGTADLACYYKVISTIPAQSSYSTSDITAYLSASKITTGDNTHPALYVGP